MNFLPAHVFFTQHNSDFFLINKTTQSNKKNLRKL